VEGDLDAGQSKEARGTMNRLPFTALGASATGSFTELAARYLQEYAEKIDIATAGLSTDELWWRPGEEGNSIGNLVLHLGGNLSLWILSGLGGRHYVRDRNGEFGAVRTGSRDELVGALIQVVASCREVVAHLSVDSMQDELSVQGYRTTGIGALFHAVEHMSYHTGQIVQTAKQIRGAAHPLEFYPRHAGE
jgi:uncharacterized damage-inducible protein DinB